MGHALYPAPISWRRRRKLSVSSKRRWGKGKAITKWNLLNVRQCCGPLVAARISFLFIKREYFCALVPFVRSSNLWKCFSMKQVRHSFPLPSHNFIHSFLFIRLWLRHLQFNLVKSHQVLPVGLVAYWENLRKVVNAVNLLKNEKNDRNLFHLLCLHVVYYTFLFFGGSWMDLQEKRRNSAIERKLDSNLTKWTGRGCVLHVLHTASAWPENDDSGNGTNRLQLQLFFILLSLCMAFLVYRLLFTIIWQFCLLPKGRNCSNIPTNLLVLLRRWYDYR